MYSATFSGSIGVMFFFSLIEFRIKVEEISTTGASITCIFDWKLSKKGSSGLGSAEMRG